jgi:hypothetical protein
MSRLFASLIATALVMLAGSASAQALPASAASSPDPMANKNNLPRDPQQRTVPQRPARATSTPPLDPQATSGNMPRSPAASAPRPTRSPAASANDGRPSTTTNAPAPQDAARRPDSNAVMPKASAPMPAASR